MSALPKILTIGAMPVGPRYLALKPGIPVH